jgi:hypothetical protein
MNTTSKGDKLPEFIPTKEAMSLLRYPQRMSYHIEHLASLSQPPRRIELALTMNPYGEEAIHALFIWLISHQPAVLFSQNKPATSQQYFFPQNK